MAVQSPLSSSSGESSGSSRKRVKIAVVDDDPELRELIQRLLQDGGYQPVILADGRGLADKLQMQAPQLLILDIMLPGQDGFELCRELRRRNHNLPIIMLTARDEEINRVLGLELGADDYVTKPFSGRELLARIKAVLRRRHDGGERRARNSYAFSGWTFLPDKMEIIGEDGLSVSLSATEAALLKTFVTHAGETLSRDELSELTNGYTSGPLSRSLDTQVSRLRRKLRNKGESSSLLIRTVWGRGYLFTAEVETR